MYVASVADAPLQNYKGAGARDNRFQIAAVPLVYRANNKNQAMLPEFLFFARTFISRIQKRLPIPLKLTVGISLRWHERDPEPASTDLT